MLETRKLKNSGNPRRTASQAGLIQPFSIPKATAGVILRTQHSPKCPAGGKTRLRLTHFCSAEEGLVNQYHASILNRITDKGGPGWTILALIIMRGWPVGVAGSSLAIGKALGWW